MPRHILLSMHDNVRAWCPACAAVKLAYVERSEDGTCTTACCTCSRIVPPTDEVRRLVGNQAISWRTS